jgi:cysteine-rich repeat protein
VQAGVEACDDGNEVQTDACLNTCVAASCGDTLVQAGVEACDDGNQVQTDACLNTCVAASCGDGHVQAGAEACDDGNQVDGDACRNDCTAGATPVVFERSFPASNCGAWNTFRGQISGNTTYNRIRISGSRSQTGVSCTGAGANTLCQALRSNSTVTVNGCGGRNWRTGGCGGGIELSANGNICGCSSGYVVRPCQGNSNWGGVNGSTCGAGGQTMRVVCD